ncbi:MAG: sigma-54 dependent transcriptional regulator [Acidobacteria bacterium]|nr:sigma-54 dependent transcriptional regulator [Acidobacteriota bacterium]
MESKLRILYTGRDEAFADLLSRTCARQSAIMLRVPEPREACWLLDEQHFDRVVLETGSGSASPEVILEQFLRNSPRLAVLVLARCPDYAESVRLARLGARAYLPLPEASLLSTDELFALIDGLAEPLAAPDRLQPSEGGIAGLVGRSPAMAKVTQLVQLIAPRQSTVLISGRTGTGKELVARAIHGASRRAQQPMVMVNCGAIPENLMEAEFFGHVKGAFTGAVAQRIGRFEQANGGTIFLDEIGELPIEMQSKLLRVLQERELQRVGSSQTMTIDVRVIAATNRDLGKMVQRGTFREDLFYRLNVVPIMVPSLAERCDDIPLLVDHILEKVCRREKLSQKTAGSEAMARLMEYRWPGNVRQLENAIEKAVALAGSRRTLYPSDFPVPASPVQLGSGFMPEVRLPAEGLDLDSIVMQFELRLLKQALERSGGNKTRAADLLRLKRTTFAAKLRTLDEREDDQDSNETSPGG